MGVHSDGRRSGWRGGVGLARGQHRSDEVLLGHFLPSLGERPFKCSECGKAFNQKGALQTHMIKHTGEKPHACAFCPAAFSQKGNLQSHVQRVHSEVSPALGTACLGLWSGAQCCPSGSREALREPGGGTDRAAPGATSKVSY